MYRNCLLLMCGQVRDDSAAVQKISEVLPKMHSIVIGPGLGRDQQLLSVVKDVIATVRSLQLPMVIDADGVYLLSLEPQIIHGYTEAILTPNVVEFARLYLAVLGRESSNAVDEVCELSKALGNVTIVKKGPEDLIASADKMLVCGEEGSARRCGGQGDLLSGSMGVFQHWTHWAATGPNTNKVLADYGSEMCAAYAACMLTRKCARHAFTLNRRSTTTSDLIAAISDVFTAHFETQKLDKF